ncbi:hypothetical protein BDV93DRAFT_554534 [Ceratobasidium sp. AG-I]|nr:hypothetical protein BDV93DRAFT_554534 [Ceratobasidium sp. AG-I]
MIALRLLLGKTGTPNSCTYENKCCSAVHDENLRLRELLEARLAIPTELESRLQNLLDENALQQILIEQLQAQLEARLTPIVPPADYEALHERAAQLETKLAKSERKLQESVAAHIQAKAHVTALQQQRAQLILELEQVEDGFQAEVEKMNGNLRSWEKEFNSFDSGAVEESLESSPSSQTHTRSSSATSESTRSTLLLNASLERTKAATRIWALEDEVDRMRGERDELRRRLGAGRANLMKLKHQASEVKITGKALASGGRGLKSESHLALGSGTVRSEMFGRKAEGRKVTVRASDMQLNTRVRPVMRGEPITPETSDDNRSLQL